MGEAVDRLTRRVHSGDRYDYAFADIRAAQIEALDERFQERRDRIKLLARRADEAGVTAVRRYEDMPRILFPHTAYKSYPENWLMDERWDRLTKWLDTVSTYRVPVDGVKDATGVDDWIDRLQRQGFNVSCSSGTTGKSAMLVASDADMAWVRTESVACYAWGSGVAPAQDRRMFGVAPVATVPRNQVSGEAQTAAYQDPAYERFAYPVPPITVGTLTEMVVLRKKIADGTARPAEIEAFEAKSAARQKSVDDAIGLTADALIAARAGKIHVGGLWGGLYAVAKAVRDKGYAAQDFHPENSIYVGGGLKRAVLPPDYQAFVYGTFNIRPERNFQNYSMQELHTGMPKCHEGGRYHLPPWLVPLILDKTGDELLPMTDGEYEGRAAFFDLSIDGRWGGVISGDKVSISLAPCACGQRGPSIRDNVVRYADLEGDDKIGCAGTVDAYVRGVA
jgi:hypothetical protein